MRYLNLNYELARRFVVGVSGKRGNVEVKQFRNWMKQLLVVYRVNNRTLAWRKLPDDHEPEHPALSVFHEVTFRWPNFTAEYEAHINRILRVMRVDLQVSYEEAKKTNQGDFIVDMGVMKEYDV